MPVLSRIIYAIRKITDCYFYKTRARPDRGLFLLRFAGNGRTNDLSYPSRVTNWWLRLRNSQYRDGGPKG